MQTSDHTIRRSLRHAPNGGLRWTQVWLALGLTVASATAWPQPVPGTPAPQASAPEAPVRPGPRLMSPEQTRDSATAPGAIRPERPALPQITVPIGKTQSEPGAAASAAQRPGGTASAPGVSDAVARCEARTSEPERRRCRAELAHQGRPGANPRTP